MMSYITADRNIHATKHSNHPYSPSLASSASCSSSSIFSVAVSVSSAASSVISSHNGSDPGSGDGVESSWDAKDAGRHTHPLPLRTQAPVPAEQRQHHRRTSRLQDGNGPSCTSSEACTMPAVPPLVREIERKVNFVDNLVDCAAQIVEAIWPAYMKSESAPTGKGVLPLRTFIQETLRRSRTSYSTLQVALYYLIIIRPQIGIPIPSDLSHEVAQRMRALQCGRRVFLAALILASKYLQDRNYSARAWSRISGLQTTEININEMAFLEAVSWRLHISETSFHRWTELVTIYTTRSIEDTRKIEWSELVLKLSPDLREALPIIERSKRKTEAVAQLPAENGSTQPPLPGCDSLGVRMTPRAPPVMAVAPPVQKVTVSSLLSERSFVDSNNASSTLEQQSETSILKPVASNSSSTPLKTPAVRLSAGTSAMACALAAAELGQFQRCTIEDMNLMSRRATFQRRSSLSTSISSSPETVTYSDSSTNSSPSRFAPSRSSSISSASSVDSVIPSKIAAQSVAGRKFSRVKISSNGGANSEIQSPSMEMPALARISLRINNTGLETPAPSPQAPCPLKTLALRLKPAADSRAGCCSRKRQRNCEHTSPMDLDVFGTTSGVTPQLKAQLQVRSPSDGAGFKRLRCGTQEASTMMSMHHGYRSHEEVS